MGLQHLLFPVADQYSDPNAWNSDEHFPIKLALALAAAALALLAAQRAQRRPATQRKEGVLGERCDAPENYSPDVLFPIPRTKGRRLLGLDDGAVPFEGEDVWNCYEVSWLDHRGRPRRGAVELRIPCESPNVVESKSLKLYLNSLNFKRFASTDEALATIRRDVASVVGCLASELSARLFDDQPSMKGWTCVDDVCEDDVPESMLRKPDASLLKTTGNVVTERLCSHNLRTLCPVTGQPDWGTLLIEYEGPRVDHASLFLYIISLRTETGFHENAVERVALDVERHCKPTKLRVTGRFLRRGGVDINPVRSIRFGAATGLAQAFAPGQ